MKRHINALLALLFIISTMTTSLHELLPHHHSSDCQVCTLVEHDSALVPDDLLDITIITPTYETILSLSDQFVDRYNSTLGSRAPPVFS